MSTRVAIIGAGNLAWHLAPNLVRIGLEVEVWSRGNVSDHQCLEWEPARLMPIPANVEHGAYQAIFLAVPDDSIDQVSAKLAAFLPPSTPLVHTSGATPINRIDQYFRTRAALWPIRSLRREEEPAKWNDLPLVFYSDDPNFESLLGTWAEEMSQMTYRLDDEQRAQLHLAAVFSNNFTTWLCQIAYELCEERGIPFSALVPIIGNTFSKIDDSAPAERQTGAAVRRDHATMQRHLSLLVDHPEYGALYRMMSQLIMDGTSEE